MRHLTLRVANLFDTASFAALDCCQFSQNWGVAVGVQVLVSIREVLCAPPPPPVSSGGVPPLCESCGNAQQCRGAGGFEPAAVVSRCRTYRSVGSVHWRWSLDNIARVVNTAFVPEV